MAIFSYGYEEQLQNLLLEYKLLHDLKENLFKETGTIITH